LSGTIFFGLARFVNALGAEIIFYLFRFPLYINQAFGLYLFVSKKPKRNLNPETKMTSSIQTCSVPMSKIASFDGTLIIPTVTEEARAIARAQNPDMPDDATVVMMASGGVWKSIDFQW
jgi:hypothetical protein